MNGVKRVLVFIFLVGKSDPTLNIGKYIANQLNVSRYRYTELGNTQSDSEDGQSLLKMANHEKYWLQAQ